MPETVIYIDPYQLKTTEKADIILITHSHYDHLSLDDIAMIKDEKTTFIAPKDAADKIEARFKTKVTILEPGQKTNIGNINIEAVAAYNPDKQYHPKANKWVGYIFTINGVKIYHAGDTGRIPEMKNITCDIALLPLGQTYTMTTVEDAVLSAGDVHAKIAIPIHYGLYEGKAEDAVTFKNSLSGKVEVVIKQKE
ncbi:MAG: MBL fold metallo-hydrolase [Bacteroidia bacterium]|nr:MBL fold metallo-hydrolase [Bacteroidia bacterium]